MPTHKLRLIGSIFAASTVLLSGCGDNDNDFTNASPPPQTVTPPAPAPTPVPAFDPDGVLEAQIRYTDYGVPHIMADNLESMAYGSAYAQARDNICILADMMIRFNSRRSEFFGPDLVLGSGDSQNLISDFGYLTLKLKERAVTQFPLMTTNSRALLTGFAAGYNKYLADTGIANIDPRCANQAHVQDITPQEMLTVFLGIAVLPGAENFLGAMFIAAPPGESPFPVMAKAEIDQDTDMVASINTSHIDVGLPEVNPKHLGSNGWGIGSSLSDTGNGIVLANPHFPHTGNLRFWQSHVTIPGHINTMGGSLVGFPGPINIGFNENMAWTHTFSASERFVVYQLTLDDSDASNQTHMVDGNRRDIFKETLSINVQVAPGAVVEFTKDSYSTNYGPMIVVPGNFDWDDTNAFAIKDANYNNFDIIDHWLGMNLAKDMDEFKQTFRDFNGLIFNNVMAASKEGEVFYIDASSVPDLGEAALNELTTNPLLIGTRQQAGFTVMPGFISAFDFAGPVPYERAPKYEGTDYVQNSNDSFWLTNLDKPITGVSPLYGEIENEQSWRSRHGHALIAARGADDKLSASEVEAGLFTDRAYLADLAYSAIVDSCAAHDGSTIDVDGNAIDISLACDVMTNWDQKMSKDSVGPHVFREFANEFRRSGIWANAFDPAMPATTPNTVANTNDTLRQLAVAVKVISDAGIAIDATFGDVQFVEKSTASGQPSGNRLPWSGADGDEGGFNIFDTDNGNDGTLLPRHTYPRSNPRLAQDLTDEGYHVTYGTSWVSVVELGDNGPVGRGLLTFSQSSNPASPHFNDQSELYSDMPQLRPLRYSEEDIAANLVETITISSQ